MHTVREIARMLPSALLGAGLLATGCGSKTAKQSPDASSAVRTENSTRIEAATARAELFSLAAAIPNDAASQVELALLDLKRGDANTAERELRECSERHPDYPRSYFQLGLLFLSQGRDQEAVAPLKRSAAMMRDDATAAETAALACFRTGAIEEAKQYAQAAIRIDERFADTYLLLARIYDAHGTAEQAIGYIDRYLSYSPHPASGYYLKGRIYARQASRDKAETWLRMAVDAEPTNPEFWTSLGRVYYELYNATKAQEGMRCYTKALEADPRNGAAHRYLGHALLEQRRYADAVSHLRASLATSADPGPVLYDLGRALLKSGETEQGRYYLGLYRQHQSYISGVQKLMESVSANPNDRKRHLALIRYSIENGRIGAAKAGIASYRARFGDDPALRVLQERAMMSTKAPGNEAGNALQPNLNGSFEDSNVSGNRSAPLFGR